MRLVGARSRLPGPPDRHAPDWHWSPIPPAGLGLARMIDEWNRPTRKRLQYCLGSIPPAEPTSRRCRSRQPYAATRVASRLSARSKLRR